MFYVRGSEFILTQKRGSDVARITAFVFTQKKNISLKTSQIQKLLKQKL
jgi:hypothetical protein